MATERLAQVLGERSRDAVVRGARDEWLDLFAEDAVVADPVGVSPLDPEGLGHRGKAAIATFWDNVIKRDPRNRMSFDYHTQYCVGDECACVGNLTNHLPDGSTFTVEGVFIYRVNDEGKLASLRTYWEFDKGVFRKGDGAA